MLTLHNFSKQYGSTPILQIPTLDLTPGIHWIQGKNGSGKSTLLKILAGLLHFKGTVTLENTIDLKKHPMNYRRLVNFAESEPAFPAFFTGWDMIKLFTNAKKASQEQLSRYINGFHMQDYLGDPLAAYSAGMIKKLSLVLAFLGNPKLILLDEPFITLDNNALNVLAQWMKESYEQKEVNFIITSHQTIPIAIPIHHTFILANRTLTHSN